MSQDIIMNSDPETTIQSDTEHQQKKIYEKDLDDQLSPTTSSSPSSSSSSSNKNLKKNSKLNLSTSSSKFQKPSSSSSSSSTCIKLDNNRSNLVTKDLEKSPNNNNKTIKTNNYSNTNSNSSNSNSRSINNNNQKNFSGKRGNREFYNNEDWLIGNEDLNKSSNVGNCNSNNLKNFKVLDKDLVNLINFGDPFIRLYEDEFRGKDEGGNTNKRMKDEIKFKISKEEEESFNYGSNSNDNQGGEIVSSKFEGGFEEGGGLKEEVGLADNNYNDEEDEDQSFIEDSDDQFL